MDFEGYPKKSFTGNRSVLKVDLFKKGGGGDSPHFVRKEGTNFKYTYLFLRPGEAVFAVPGYVS